MSNGRGFDFEISPAVRSDLELLNNRVLHNPKDAHSRNLLQVSINVLVELQNGGHGTKALEYLPSYPDLSDCRSSYVGGDPNSKPSHRIVWRDVPSENPDGPARREIIALGERKNGSVYYTAGQRLGRPIGYTLAELRTQREPTVDISPNKQRTSGYSSSARVENDLEFD